MRTRADLGNPPALTSPNSDYQESGYGNTLVRHLRKTNGRGYSMPPGLLSANMRDPGDSESFRYNPQTWYGGRAIWSSAGAHAGAVWGPIVSIFVLERADGFDDRLFNAAGRAAYIVWETLSIETGSIRTQVRNGANVLKKVNSLTRHLKVTLSGSGLN